MTKPNMKQTRDRILQIVKTVSQTCKEGKEFDRLAPFFHDHMVMSSPGFDRRAEGKAACLINYEDACSQMVFRRFEGSNEHIDIIDNTAVVTYRYDCVWDYQGKTFTDDGHEIFVFIRKDEDWQIIWRTLIPGSRQIQAYPSEKDESNKKQNIRDICLDLMKTSPNCQLTTIDAEGFPHTTAMNNLRYAQQYPSLVKLHEEDDNDFVLYLSTSMQSPKMTRMQINPKASVYFCNHDQITGLMLGGEIEIITDQKLKNRIWQKGWTMYYPSGPEGPEYGVFKLVPKIVKGWYRNGPFEIKL